MTEVGIWRAKTEIKDQKCIWKYSSIGRILSVIRVGKILDKYKAGKYFIIEINDGQLNFSVNQDAVTKDEAYDGRYVIRTDVKPEHMTIKEVVDHYRVLAKVEQAFRC